MAAQIRKHPQQVSDIDSHLDSIVSTSPPSSSSQPPYYNSRPAPPGAGIASARPALSLTNRISSHGNSLMRGPAPPSPLSQVAGGASTGISPPEASIIMAPRVTVSSTGLVHTHPGAADHHLKKKHVHIADDNSAPPPCFIHSGLDKHGSLQDWLRGKSEHLLPHHRKNRERVRADWERPHAEPVPARSARRVPLSMTPTEHRPELDKAKDRRPPRAGMTSPLADGYESDKSSFVDTRTLDSAMDDDDDDDDDDDAPSSLTKQLAATAQGVREVSKELGRTKVHSRIQHVLIVTKARDNRLIKLTRELALYLMLKSPTGPPSTAASSTSDLRGSSSDRPERPPRRGMVVYVDAQLRTSKRFDAEGIQRDHPQLFEPMARRRSSSTSASTTSISTMASSWSAVSQPDKDKDSTGRRRDEGQLRYWTADMCSNSPQLFDFVVTLGGDGTVLFTSWLFQKIVPPVLPFALGSLGFLTNFDFKDYSQTMDRVIEEGIRVNLRMRFTCTVYRAMAPEEMLVVKKHGKRKAIRRPGGEILVRQVDKDGWEALEGRSPLSPPDQQTGGKDKEIMCFSTRPVEQFEVLNDLVVDRGPSPFVSLLEIFGDDHHLTTVQADGLTVSTPTGSTAYSLSAGGSLVHPQIPALLLTPICPHTLSFRPMLLPDSMELRICVPYNSRSTAWASFDGRGRVELKQGDHIKITASKYPFPTVCADKQSTDWFKSISRTLRWNERERQKSFVVVEEDEEPAKPHHDRANGDATSGRDEGSDSSESDESSEDEFDIDDRSGGEMTPSPQGTNAGTAPVPSRKLRSLIAMDVIDSQPSGVQSPDRFASGYYAPPPLSQRHLLERLASVESQLRQANLGSDPPSPRSDADGDMSPLPEEIDIERPPLHHLASEVREVRESLTGDYLDSSGNEIEPVSDSSTGSGIPSSLVTRCESDATLAPSASEAESRGGRSDSGPLGLGARTPRQGRSRSRSRHSTHRLSRGNSPAPGSQLGEGKKKTKAFAFFGQDDSTSELSDPSD